MNELLEHTEFFKSLEKAAKQMESGMWITYKGRRIFIPESKYRAIKKAEGHIDWKSKVTKRLRDNWADELFKHKIKKENVFPIAVSLMKRVYGSKKERNKAIESLKKRMTKFLEIIKER